MEFTFETAAKEAETEFGSLVITDAERGTVTLLSPVWLEDPSKLARIRDYQKSLTEAQEANDVTQLVDMRDTVVDMLAECADNGERWRALAADKPFPVLLQVMKRWQESSQPGEA